MSAIKTGQMWAATYFNSSVYNADQCRNHTEFKNVSKSRINSDIRRTVARKFIQIFFEASLDRHHRHTLHAGHHRHTLHAGHHRHTLHAGHH